MAQGLADSGTEEPGSEGVREDMSNNGILIIDMAILVGIFLLGLLAKLFPGTAATPARNSEQ